MRAQTPHINRTQQRFRLRSVLLLCALVACPLVASAIVVSPSPASPSGYYWPVKPFKTEHPVRGVFGDPRTLFNAPPTTDGTLLGSGDFQFHFGIDVSAADGTGVYPVVSGTVSLLREDAVTVSCSDGRAFEYWHIKPALGVGTRVSAYATVLGRILHGAQQVHLSELLDGVYVNPLQSGHLRPYTDTKAPHIVSISIGDSTRELALPAFVRGPVDLVVEVTDDTNLPVPGEWRDLPVAPALVTWRVKAVEGKTVVPPTVAVGFRRHFPDNSTFWSTYARAATRTCRCSESTTRTCSLAATSSVSHARSSTRGSWRTASTS